MVRNGAGHVLKRPSSDEGRPAGRSTGVRKLKADGMGALEIAKSLGTGLACIPSEGPG